MPSTAKAFLKKESRVMKSSHNFYNVDWNYIGEKTKKKNSKREIKKRGGAREG